jgi:hypothetical protein
MEKECSKENKMQDPGEASIELKKRDRREASKLSPKLLNLIVTLFLAEMEPMELSLVKDPELGSTILQTLTLKTSREPNVTGLSLLRRLGTSKFL